MGKAAINVNLEPTRTQQSAKDECDINKIVERAKKGAEPPVSDRQPMYGDFTQVPTDLREAMVMVVTANNAFMQLDAHLRKRFDNDPAVLVDFVKDPKNREEAISLGLVKAPEEPVVVDVPSPSPSPSPLSASSGAKKSKAPPKEADDE